MPACMGSIRAVGSDPKGIVPINMPINDHDKAWNGMGKARETSQSPLPGYASGIACSQERSSTTQLPGLHSIDTQ